MLIIKKIFGPLLLPVSLCGGILLVGVLVLWFSRRKGSGKILVTLGTLIFLVLGYAPVPNALLHSLESRHAPLLTIEGLQNVRWIVVLGGGHVSEPRLSFNSQLSNESLSRLVEGIRLQKLLRGSKLILSGGALFDPVPEAVVMEGVAIALGVEKGSLVLESESKDTEEEAVLVQKMVGSDPFILVTSASHMPRAMALFEKRGMQPIAAPTDFKVKDLDGTGIQPGKFFPGAGNLEKAEIAFYEYLGWTWAKWRGRI